MTAFPVPFNNRSISYTAVGGETSFVTDFPLDLETDLAVTRTRSAVTATLVLTTDYTVSIAADTGIATITPVAAVLASDVWVLSGETVIERVTDLPARPSSDTMAALNREFDRIIMMLQEVVRDISFAGGTVVDASAIAKGIIEIATNAEWLAMTATDKAVVPSNLAAKPTFLGDKNAVDQTGITSTVATKVTAATEQWDIGGYYASSTWTPPAGKYRVHGQATFTAANGVDNELLLALIYKNGSAHRYTANKRGGTTAETVVINALVTANGTDTFEFYVRKDGAGDGTLSGIVAETFFCGEMI